MNDDCLVKDLSFRVHHTMLLPVADLDRSVAFYTRLLGMKVKERHASEARKVEVVLDGLERLDPRSGRPRARIGRTASAHVILRIPGRPPSRDSALEVLRKRMSR